MTSPVRAADPQEAASHPAAASADKGRDYYFDNAKFLLMVVVVFGHSLALAAGTRPVHAVYMTVYTFHMPAFLIISGYFSRSFTATPRRVQRLVGAMLLPYAIFQTVYTAVRALTEGEPFAWNLLHPVYMMWFLPALFMWRLSTPVWQTLRWPMALAVLLSLICGLQKVSFLLAVVKVLAMAPFFVLGLRLRREHFAALRRPVVRVASVALFAATLAGFWLLDNHASRDWVLWTSSYHQMHRGLLTGAALRAAMIVAGVVLSAAFFSLVPTGRTFYTRFGTATMNVFLLHGLLLMPLWARPDWDGLPYRSSVVLPLLTVGSVLLTFVLCMPWLARVVRPITEPRGDWLFRSDRKA